MKRQYNAHRPLPFELRATCVKEVMLGASRVRVAAKYGVAQHTVGRWVAEFRTKALSLEDLVLLSTTDLGKELLRVLR